MQLLCRNPTKLSMSQQLPLTMATLTTCQSWGCATKWSLSCIEPASRLVTSSGLTYGQQNLRLA